MAKVDHSFFLDNTLHLFVKEHSDSSNIELAAPISTQDHIYLADMAVLVWMLKTGYFDVDIVKDEKGEAKGITFSAEQGIFSYSKVSIIFDEYLQFSCVKDGTVYETMYDVGYVAEALLCAFDKEKITTKLWDLETF